MKEVRHVLIKVSSPMGTSQQKVPRITCGACSRKGTQLMDDLTQTISNLVGILLGVVGGVGVAYFVFGAYQYLTASGAPHQMERGKTAMLTALAGIVLALVAFGVVELVIDAVANPVVEISEPPAPSGASSGGGEPDGG